VWGEGTGGGKSSSSGGLEPSPLATVDDKDDNSGPVCRGETQTQTLLLRLGQQNPCRRFPVRYRYHHLRLRRWPTTAGRALAPRLARRPSSGSRGSRCAAAAPPRPPSSSLDLGPRINQSPPRSAPAEHPALQPHLASHHLRRLPDDTLRPRRVRPWGSATSAQHEHMPALQMPQGPPRNGSGSRQPYGSEEKIAANPVVNSALRSPIYDPRREKKKRDFTGYRGQ